GDGVLWFASQARALAQVAPVDSGREAASLAGFYLWGHVPEPFTWWSGIRAFPPGHLQRVRVGATPGAPRALSSVEEAYLASTAQPVGGDELRGLLRDSLRHHLVADVPVGVFLSAGVDSNVVAALAAEQNSSRRTVAPAVH